MKNNKAFKVIVILATVVLILYNSKQAFTSVIAAINDNIFDYPEYILDAVSLQMDIAWIFFCLTSVIALIFILFELFTSKERRRITGVIYKIIFAFLLISASIVIFIELKTYITYIQANHVRNPFIPGIASYLLNISAYVFLSAGRLTDNRQFRKAAGLLCAIVICSGYATLLFAVYTLNTSAGYLLKEFALAASMFIICNYALSTTAIKKVKKKVNLDPEDRRRQLKKTALFASYILILISLYGLIFNLHKMPYRSVIAGARYPYIFIGAEALKYFIPVFIGLTYIMICRNETVYGYKGLKKVSLLVLEAVLLLEFIFTLCNSDMPLSDFHRSIYLSVFTIYIIAKIMNSPRLLRISLFVSPAGILLSCIISAFIDFSFITVIVDLMTVLIVLSGLFASECEYTKTEERTEVFERPIKKDKNKHNRKQKFSIEDSMVMIESPRMYDSTPEEEPSLPEVYTDIEEEADNEVGDTLEKDPERNIAVMKILTVAACILLIVCFIFTLFKFEYHYFSYICVKKLSYSLSDGMKVTYTKNEENYILFDSGDFNTGTLWLANEDFSFITGEDKWYPPIGIFNKSESIRIDAKGCIDISFYPAGKTSVLIKYKEEGGKNKSFLIKDYGFSSLKYVLFTNTGNGELLKYLETIDKTEG